MEFQKIARTAQTLAPWIADVKPWLQRRYCIWRNTPFESDFNLLRFFPGSRLQYVDIGANRGQSIDAIRITANRPRIVSFEANPVLASKLDRALAAENDILIHPVGLGEKPGEFTLYLPRYRNYVFDGLASFHEEHAMSWLSSETLLRFDPAKLSCITVQCRVRTLDEFHLEPFFMKLDIQGFELAALKGAQITLRRHSPVLLIETPEPALFEFVSQFGYKPYHFKNGKIRLGAGDTVNMWFMTDDKASLLPFHARADA